MINRIRVATAEEVASIAEKSDIQPGLVLALSTPEGTPLAVIRTVTEVDPMFFPEKLSDRMKAMFIRDVETVLAAQGIQKYYFNVLATNEKMINYSTHYGAVKQSVEPEVRFSKVL